MSYSQNYATIVADDGAIAAWPLHDDGEDIIGTNNMVPVGATFGEELDGSPFTNFASFDGVDDRMEAAAINLAGPLTYEVWVRVPIGWAGSEDGAQIIALNDRVGIRRESGVTNWAMTLRNDAATDLGSFGNWGSDSWDNTNPIYTTWQHLVMTYSGTALRTYIDGLFVRQINASGAAATNVIGNRMTLGAQHAGPSSTLLRRYFAGSIAWPAIYDIDLTSTQVAVHYEAITSPVEVPELGTLTNEGSGIRIPWTHPEPGATFDLLRERWGTP